MLGDLGGWHFLIILAVVLLLFGATKLPALAKGVGQSVRIFRTEMAKPDDAAKKDGTTDTSAATPSTDASTVENASADDTSVPHPKS